jgi:hypothetical protein
LFAPPHGLSQRTTSFIASCHQGIHRMPLSRLIALIINARHMANTEDHLRSAAENGQKDQIMRDKPNSRAVSAAALRRSRVGPQAYPFFTMVRSTGAKSQPVNGVLTLFAQRNRCWWSQTGSNRRPQACKASALPTELWPQSQTTSTGRKQWWAWVELNYRPHAYQACALTT